MESLLRKAVLLVQTKKISIFKLDIRNKFFAGLIIQSCLGSYLPPTFYGESTNELNIIISALIPTSIAEAFNYFDKKYKS